MARQVGKKTAIGSGNGDCSGCLKPIAKGERMTAVSEGIKFKGYFCDECIRKWTPPVFGAEIEERPGPLIIEIDDTEKPQ